MARLRRVPDLAQRLRAGRRDPALRGGAPRVRLGRHGLPDRRHAGSPGRTRGGRADDDLAGARRRSARSSPGCSWTRCRSGRRSRCSPHSAWPCGLGHVEPGDPRRAEPRRLVNGGYLRYGASQAEDSLRIAFQPHDHEGRTMTRITTPFGHDSTAAEVVAGIDLTGRRAIVTGGASGIGIETARALAGAGAEVTLAVRDTGRRRPHRGRHHRHHRQRRRPRRPPRPRRPRVDRRVRGRAGRARCTCWSTTPA